MSRVSFREIAMSSPLVVASMCHQERCSLCREGIRGSHSHPVSWSCEMRELLASYQECEDLCVCKANELSVRRLLRSKEGKGLPR